MGKYRIYFLVFEDIDIVLLITISDKKVQQEIIDKIKSEFGLLQTTHQKESL